VKEEQASSTAFTVVQGILYTARRSDLRGLVDDEMVKACHKILAASQEGQRRLRQLNSFWFRGIAKLLERLTLPGITVHYVLRKKFIEDYVLESVAKGATQVINLGAGFDTLAYRLSQENPEVNFIEIDHPATHKVKVEALSGPDTPKDNLHFIPVDFAKQKLEDVLRESSAFDKDRSTVCIVEGVLMYLDISDVSHLFQALKELIHAPVRCVFTAVEPMSEHPKSFGPLLKLYLAMKGEPMNWTCLCRDMPAFVEEQGYTLGMVADADEFKKRYLSSDYKGFLHRGEYGVTLERL
jgi:methyltransferase (TIGR00027 family)